MQNINWEVWSVVIATMLTGIVMAVAIYFTTKNLTEAVVDGIGVIAKSTATITAVEGVYTDLMPDEWEPVVISVVEALKRQAAGTATEADDAVLDLLSRIIDGLPNE